VGVNEGVAFDAHIVGLTINYARAWDTKRQKYVDASVMGLAEWGSVDPNFDVEEYLVMATEGGEWLNYTRTNFNGSYIVYLRHGCALTEQVNLYKLGGTDPNPLNHTFTNLLGTFYCTNAMMWNYRYAPLLDASGKPAVVSLTNQTTLRLEIAPPQQDSTKYGMAMNYLAFVPYVATPMKLYSTAQVKGSGTVWTEETSATVDTANHRITVAQNGTRYYQVRWSSKTKVTGVSRSGLNIILTYQEVP
jgi:hypothetical protein